MRLSSTTTRMRKGNGDKRGDRDICDDPRKDLDGFNIMLYPLDCWNIQARLKCRTLTL